MKLKDTYYLIWDNATNDYSIMIYSNLLRHINMQIGFWGEVRVEIIDSNTATLPLFTELCRLNNIYLGEDEV